MNITLTCPHCGPRPIQEYLYGEVPETPDSISDPNAIDLDRAFMRKNTEGPQVERWFHVYGCRRWITVKRDTRTDEILSVEA